MIDIADIVLTPTKALLLHRLNRNEQLLRCPADFLSFRIGPVYGPFNAVLRLAAEALIDYRLVDNHGPLDEKSPLQSVALFLINDRGRAWCAAYPENAGS